MNINTKISIEGKELSAFVSLEICQAFNAHHSFVLIIKQDILVRQAHTIQTTQEYIGKFINVGFGANGSQDNFFKGVITECSLSQGNGSWANLILKGYSPTYLLEGGKHCASFSGKSLENIARQLTSDMAGNDLNSKIKPQFTDSIKYCCQYNESNFEFLNRLAIDYGEWFYYDGLHLFFGKPPEQNSLRLIYGEHLENINFSLKLIPYKSIAYAYNMEDDVVIKATSSISKGDAFMMRSIGETDKIYSKEIIQVVPQAVATQAELNRLTKNQQAKKAAQTLVLTAKGDNPKVKIGGLIEMVIQEKDLAGKDTSENATFIVTSVTHYLDGTGRYHHHLEGVSSKVECIPAQLPGVFAETQIAVVHNNDDPLGLGRVKVQMHWQIKSGEFTEWIRVLTPNAGSSSDVEKNRGFTFVPEVGDQVILGFEHHHPDKPFVMGSVFHGKNGSGGGDSNNVKAIKTRSGHTIAFDDTNGSESIIISDKKNNVITLDTSTGSITISASENISLSAKNIDLNARENITLTAGSDLSSSAKDNLSLSAGNNFVQNAGKDISIAAKNINQQAQENVTVDSRSIENNAKEVKVNSSEKDMLLTSGKKVNMQSGERIKLF